ncbi:MAG: hypothetical protein HY699_10005 [Deltaproteobacteria bacterium]|nr:hypothetical protein [Deltaproteobacteria bacterium]
MRLGIGCAVGLALLAGSSGPARAGVQYGALQLAGSLESQNLVRHSAATKFQFEQNRNTLRLRVDWDWLQDGRFINKFNVPFLKESKLYFLYRGAYDGFYAIAPEELQHGQTRFDDIVGGPVQGNEIGTLRPDGSLRQGLYSRFTDSDRRDLAWENRLREAYVDVRFADVPLSLRLGRQQVVWGEADQFRLMDVWNPLDVTWRFPYETFDNYRVPLWMAKGLWDFGVIGPFQNTFVEVVYNPFDFQPGTKVAWLPRPWALPYPDPLRAGQINVPSKTNNLFFTSPVFNLQGTSYQRGDFNRNPEEASEVGVRFHTVTPQGLEFTTNYIYGRGKAIGYGQPFGVHIEKIQVDQNNQTCVRNKNDPACFSGMSFAGTSVVPTFVTAKVVHPYVHIFGFTANYFEDSLTSIVFRLETAYSLGQPYQTTAKDEQLIVQDMNDQPVIDPVTGDFALSTNQLTKRDIWAGMLGFDRPTWIRWLNQGNTFFLTGQFFWQYINGNSDELRGAVSAGQDPYFSPSNDPNNPPVLPYSDELVSSGGVGAWQCRAGADPSRCRFAGQVERLQDGTAFGADDLKRWEFLMTLAVNTFYRGGTIVPLGVGLYDPMSNAFAALLEVSYAATPDLTIALQQRYFTSFGRTVNDPWTIGGRMHRRDETGLKITYQF